MTLSVTFSAGQRILAASLNSIVAGVNSLEASHRIITKEADETVHNNNTLQDDNELLASIEASSKYKFEFCLFTSTDATADIKVAVTFPTGAWVAWGPVGYEVTGTNYQAMLTSCTYRTASGTPRSHGGGGDYPFIRMAGLLRVGTTPGNLQLQWAQNTATAVNTTVKADSWLEIWKL